MHVRFPNRRRRLLDLIYKDTSLVPERLVSLITVTIKVFLHLLCGSPTIVFCKDETNSYAFFGRPCRSLSQQYDDDS